MRKFLASLLEIFEIAVIAIVAVFLVRTFLIQPFLVSGTSMSPNFSNGDYVLVDELTYRIRPPERGEVVVFHDPEDYGTYFIKRIIGLPGERVTIASDTVTVYNASDPAGFALDETYLPKGLITSGERKPTRFLRAPISFSAITGRRAMIPGVGDRFPRRISWDWCGSASGHLTRSRLSRRRNIKDQFSCRNQSKEKP